MQVQDQSGWPLPADGPIQALPEGLLEQRLQQALLSIDAPQGDPALGSTDFAWLRQAAADDHIAAPVLAAGARVLLRAARGEPVNRLNPVVALHADPRSACLPALVLLAWMLCGVGLHAVVIGPSSSRGALNAGEVFAAMGVSAGAEQAQIASSFARGDPAYVPLASISPNLDAWLRLPYTDARHRLARSLVPWADPIGAPGDLRVVMTTDEAWARSCANVAQSEGLQALILHTDAQSGSGVPNARTRAWLASQGGLTLLPVIGTGIDADRSAPGPDADAVQTARWVQSILAGEFPVPRQAERLVDLVAGAVGRTLERSA